MITTLPSASGALPLADAAASARAGPEGSAPPASAGAIRQINPAAYADEPIVRFARDVLDFPLWPGQQAILGHVYRENVRLAVLRLGRRSGKDRSAAVAATFEATVNSELHLAAVPPGEQPAVVVVAKAQSQARETAGMIRGFLTKMARLDRAYAVVRDTRDELVLANGMRVLVMPCHAANVRGLAVAVAILTEVAHWTGVDGSPLDPREVYEAVDPATAQFPAGRIFVLSTPKYAHGWFHDICRRAERGLPGMRAYQATTRQMAPRSGPGGISDAWLDQKAAEDPLVFRREYEAEFTAAVAAVFDAELVLAAVAKRRDLPPQEGLRYLVTLDPAAVADTFSAIVGHREPSGRIVVDAVRGWRGSRVRPVLLEPTLDEIAELSVLYNGAPVVTDQSSAQFILQGLRRRGLTVREQPWTADGKAKAAGAVRHALNAGRLELPDHRELIAELCSLEQRPLPSGLSRIAAPGRLHDDYATALMQLVHDLSVRLGDVRVLGVSGQITYLTREEYEREGRARYLGEMTVGEQRDATHRMNGGLL